MDPELISGDLDKYPDTSANIWRLGDLHYYMDNFTNI